MLDVPPASREAKQQQRQSRGTDECSWHGISLQKIADKTLNSSGGKKKKDSAKGFDLLFECRISTLVKVNEERKAVENF